MVHGFGGSVLDGRKGIAEKFRVCGPAPHIVVRPGTRELGPSQAERTFLPRLILMTHTPKVLQCPPSSQTGRGPSL